MAQITWLHLSDWHQNSEKHDRKVLSHKLLENLQARAALDSRLAQVDFVVFSGDAANHGKAAEFEAVRNVLFDPVLKLLELGPDRLFIVPGNHDLDRSHVEDMLPAKLQRPLTDHEAVKNWLCDDKRRERALEPLSAYTDFVRGFTGQDCPAYAPIRRWKIAEKQVVLLGLNTAWMCGRKDAAGNVDDKGRIVIGEPQIHDALVDISDADLRIVVQHHAFEWLADFDRNKVEREIRTKVDVILWGHEHQSVVDAPNNTKGNAVIIAAGPTYDERDGSDSAYVNAFNLTTLNLDNGKGEAFIRRWSEKSKKWVADTDTCDNGRFPFTLPRAADKPAPAPETQERRLARAAARYQELLLESCDIVNLANLPEQDRHVAARKMELRRLYVPLSVLVEPVAGVEAEKTFDELEARRAAALGRGELRVVGARQRAAPGERLKEAKRLVVLGDPGAGKTTLTRWFTTAFLLKLKGDAAWREMPAAETLPDAPLLPVVVRCRDLDGAVCRATLDDVLKHTLRKAEFSEALADDIHAYLRAEIDAGRALLILDGLDEINEPTLRAGFCEQIDRIARANKQTPIIVTSRIVGYRELGIKLSAKFEHLTLAGFDRDEKDAFARNWCRLVEPPERQDKAAEELIHDIHSNDRIERLTANPMLLTTMALVKRSVGRLPQRRVKLYDEAVKVLLKWRGEYQTPLEEEEALPQLQYLAYAMCDRGVQRLAKDDALKLLDDLRKKHPNLREIANRSPKDFLRLVESGTGIMMEAGRERIDGRLTPVYEFRHLTIQEYFASRAVIERVFPGVDPAKPLARLVAPLAGRTEEKEVPFGEPEIMVMESWREPLRLLATGCANHEVDAVLTAILTPLNEELTDNRRARAVQAALCLADEPTVSDSVAHMVINALIAAVVPEEGYHRVRRTGVDAAVEELGASPWRMPLSAKLVQEFLSRPAHLRGRYGDLTEKAGNLRSLSEANIKAWLNNQIARLDGSDAEAADAALMIRYAVYIGKISPQQMLADKLAGYLDRSPAVAHAVARALYWVADQTQGEILVSVQPLLDYLAKSDTDVRAAGWCMLVMSEGKTPLPLYLYDRYRQSDHRPVRQDSLGAVSVGLSEDDRALLSVFYSGSDPFLDPAEPITLVRVREAAKKLEKPEAEICARYVELAERFDLILDFDAE